MPSLAEIDAEIARRQQAPSLADIDAEIAKRQSTEQPDDSFPGASIIEPAASVVSGLASTAAGGLAGIAQTLNPLAEEGAGADAVKTVQEAGTFVPRTKAGQEGLKTLGDLVQQGIDIVNYPISGLAGLVELLSGQGIEQATKTVEGVQNDGVAKTAGERTFEETGSPLAAAAAETAPAVVETLIGAKALTHAPKAAEIAKNTANTTKEVTKKIFTQQSATKQKIAKKIAEGSTDVDTAKFKLKDPSFKGNRVEFSPHEGAPLLEGPRIGDSFRSGGPKIVKDKVAIEAIKQGFDEGVIATVKGSSGKDKAIMRRMVSMMERGKKNARFGAANRPSDVVGESVMRRFKVVQRANKAAAKRLDRVARSLKGHKVDFDPAVNKFASDLKQMGIQVGDDLKLGFKGSDVEGLDGPIRILTTVFRRMKNTKPPDAFDVHRMKKFIDEQVTFGKNAEGLAGKSERILKKLRHNLDATLDKQFPNYDKVNSVYAETRGVIDALQDVAGKKMNLSGPNAEKAVGTLMRRLMSNAQSRVNLLDSVDDLEKVAAKFGGKIDDDLMTQILFVDELDTVFGPAAKTSLAGDTVKGVKHGVEAAAGQRTLAGVAIDAGAAGVERLRGINQDGAFKAIKKLLESNSLQ